MDDYVSSIEWNRAPKYMPDVPDPEGDDPNAVPEDPNAGAKYFTFDGGQEIGRQKDVSSGIEIWKFGHWVPDAKRHGLSEGQSVDQATAQKMIDDKSASIHPALMPPVPKDLSSKIPPKKTGK